MPLAQPADHRAQIQLLVLQQHQQVIDQIRSFVDQLFAIVDRGGQRGFHAFLPDLLRDALGAAGVQAGGVRAVRAGVLALRQQLLQLIEERPVAGGRVEATAVAEVAGRADRVGQYQQRVVIAVRRDADHLEEVAGAFTLGPQALLGAREEGDVAALLGGRQRFRRHITQHQHFAGNGVLHDGRHQAVGFFPVQLVG